MRMRPWVLLAVLAAPAACRHPPEGGAAPFVLGAVPSLEIEAKRRELAPLIDYLTAELGVPVELRAAASYAGTREDLNRRVYDAAYVGPILYVRAHEAGYDVVATPLRRGQTWTRGVILARPGGAVKTPADVKGRTVMFVDEGSSTGYQWTVALLYALGLRPGDYRAAFAGTHDAAVRAVAEGKVDAGACYDGAVDTALAEADRGKVVVVGKTDPVPHEVFAVRRGHPLAAAFRKAILAMPQAQAGPTILARIRAEGIAAVTDEDFSSAKNVDLLISEIAP